MKDFRKKFRLIFVPYLILLAACMAGYSLFNWYVYLRPEDIKSRDMEFFAIGPGLISIAVVLIWLRPRLRLLTKKLSRGGAQFNLNMLAIMGIAIPLGAFQLFLTGATGKFTQLEIPSDIDKVPVSKYYGVKQFSALKQFTQVRIGIEYAKNKRFYYKVFIAMPLLDSSLQIGVNIPLPALPYNQELPGRYVPQVWMCMEYKSESLKGVTTAWKEKKKVEFLESSMKKFYETDLSMITYWERMNINKETTFYVQTIGSFYKLRSTKGLVMMKACYRPFNKRNDCYLAVTIGSMLFFFLVLLAIFGIYDWNEERLQEFEDKRR